MIIKCAGDDGKSRAPKKLWCSRRNKNHFQKDFDPAIDSNDNGGDDDAMKKEK